MQSHQHVAITINRQTLQSLIKDKAICLSDLHCLDKASKREVRRMFLKSLVGAPRN